MRSIFVNNSSEWVNVWRECYYNEKYNKKSIIKFSCSHWISNLFANEYYYMKLTDSEY